MNASDAEAIQLVLSYFLDPDGQVDDIDAMAAAVSLADAAYEARLDGLMASDVADMFGELIEASGELDDGRPIEDVPVGDLL